MQSSLGNKVSVKINNLLDSLYYSISGCKFVSFHENYDTITFFLYSFFKVFYFLNWNNLIFLFNYIDNMLLVLMLYFFFKSVLLSSMLELIWPTHIFNKKNNFSYSLYKKKSFIEVFLKFKNYNSFLNILNKFFIKY